MSPSKKKAPGNAIRGPVAIVFIIIVAAIYLFQQWQGNPTGQASDGGVTPLPPNEVTRSIPQAQTQANNDAIEVFFTDPLAGNTTGGVENHLVEAIEQAGQTIDVAIYNISLPNVTDALIDAHERGVVVRMVMESEAMGGRSAERLIDAGITVIGDEREGLMHNKFVIIDSQEVWMGSMNFTNTAAYSDFNNLVRIRAQRVAQNYAVEFDELFVEGLFGPNGRDNTPYPQVSINGIPVEIYFSPDDGVTEEVVAELALAKESITFMAYSFTSDPIAEVMLERAAAGVKVSGVFDQSQYESNQGGEYDALAEAGLDVWLDGIPGLQHHKVIIIDGRTVITGSFNFSAAAENNNDENLVIIHDSAIAAQYLKAFEPVYESAR